MPLDRETIYTVIEDECLYQRLRWGDPEGKGKHELDSFITYIADYARQLVTHGTRGPNVEKLNDLRKIAALCVSAMEQHGCNTRALEDESKLDG